MARRQHCVDGQAKAVAVCCRHCPSALSAGKRCINPRSDGNPRKLISPKESYGRVAVILTRVEFSGLVELRRVREDIL
jgi:hypothetical protein